jgi:hypothetical protein
MLKLTRFDDSPIYVRAKCIGAIWTGDSPWTTIECGKWQHSVKETPEQILAMPEMLNELYPPMLVTKGSVPDSYEPGGMTFIR